MLLKLRGAGPIHQVTENIGGGENNYRYCHELLQGIRSTSYDVQEKTKLTQSGDDKRKRRDEGF